MSNSRRARRNVARHQPLRLRESATAVLDPPTRTVEAVSNRPWSEFTQADYSPAQWRRACLIDTGRGAEDSKDRYALPVREPSGTVNRNGVHAAAGRLNQVDAPAEVKRRAARALVRLYRSELDEDPPPRLLSMAGQGGSESDRTERATIAETVPVAIREAPSGSPMTVDLQIIQAGWNSSGTRYYPPEMLARDIPKVYPAGTHMYLDHPTATEEAELPERSVTRLAAVLAEDPYTTNGGSTMRAKARIFAPHREFIRETWRDIGVSINGAGDGRWGEMDGRSGQIIDSLTHGRSIDFVTKPGAGGRILQLFESAVDVREARNVGGWLEARIHAAFTNIADEMYGDGRLTREERITLSSAIGSALDAFVSRLEADGAQLYQRDLYDEPDNGSSPDDEPEEATEVRESDPTPPPAPPAPEPPPAPGPQTPAPEADPATDNADGTPPAAPPTEEGDPPMSGETQTGTSPAPAGTQPGPSPEVRAELAEARLREAEARISELTTQTATLTSERDTARGELARLRVTEAARGVVGSALGSTDLPDAARARVTEAVTRDVPTTAEGQLDGQALTARISEAIERERTYIASIREAAGEGRPNGLGGGSTVPDPEPFRQSLFESFRGLGMSEQAARAAANGR